MPEIKRVWHHRKPLGGWEQELLARIGRGPAARTGVTSLGLGGVANVQHVQGGLEGMDPLINHLYGPTFNIAGLRSGFLGAETGTIPFIVPARATATLDIRMVVDLSRRRSSTAFAGISIGTGSPTSRSTCSPRSMLRRRRWTTRRAVGLEDAGELAGDHDVWPIQGGGGPGPRCPTLSAYPACAAA